MTQYDCEGALLANITGREETSPGAQRKGEINQQFIASIR